jgi:hypothetical protein
VSNHHTRPRDWTKPVVAFTPEHQALADEAIEFAADFLPLDEAIEIAKAALGAFFEERRHVHDARSYVAGLVSSLVLSTLAERGGAPRGG